MTEAKWAEVDNDPGLIFTLQSIQRNAPWARHIYVLQNPACESVWKRKLKRNLIPEASKTYWVDRCSLFAHPSSEKKGRSIAQRLSAALGGTSLPRSSVSRERRVWVPLTTRLCARLEERYPGWMSFVRSHRRLEGLDSMEDDEEVPLRRQLRHRVRDLIAMQISVDGSTQESQEDVEDEDQEEGHEKKDLEQDTCHLPPACCLRHPALRDRIACHAARLLEQGCELQFHVRQHEVLAKPERHLGSGSYASVWELRLRCASGAVPRRAVLKHFPPVDAAKERAIGERLSHVAARADTAAEFRGRRHVAALLAAEPRFVGVAPEAPANQELMLILEHAGDPLEQRWQEERSAIRPRSTCPVERSAIVEQLLEGVELLGLCGVVHADISASNCCIDDAGVAARQASGKLERLRSRYVHHPRFPCSERYAPLG
eukprot:g23450.t1